MFVVNAPVPNDPVVPLPPPLGEEQDVALVDDHEMVELALYPTDDGLAETDTVGAGTQDEPFQAVPVVQEAVIVLVAS